MHAGMRRSVGFGCPVPAGTELPDWALIANATGRPRTTDPVTKAAGPAATLHGRDIYSSKVIWLLNSVPVEVEVEDLGQSDVVPRGIAERGVDPVGQRGR